ncbi:hypothetical protein ACYOEI_27040 [Singulisphaera rosea]
MSRPKRKARPVDKPGLMLLIAAFEAFTKSGESSVLCDACCTPIDFVPLSETVWKHHCSCGKFNGNLKGL